MKICVSCTGNKLDGYLSITLNPVVGFTNMEAAVPPASAEEILAEDLIEFFPLKKVEQAIDYLLSKLRHKGQITLSCKDIYVLNYLITRREFDITNINLALYGDSLSVRSVLSSEDLINILTSRGLKIVKKIHDGIKAIVVAERQ